MNIENDFSAVIAADIDFFDWVTDGGERFFFAREAHVAMRPTVQPRSGYEPELLRSAS